MKTTILHLSHTDIRRDSRILKELKALRPFAEEKGFRVRALGILERGAKSAVPPTLEGIEILTMECFVRKLWVPHRLIRHGLVFLEIIVRFLFLGLKLRPAVVHCHDTMVLPVALLVSIISRAQLVYDAHELETDRNGQGKLEQKVTMMFEKIAWSAIDFFISVSPSINNFYVEKYGPKANEVILNAPELTSVEVGSPSLASALRERLGISPEDRLFVYLGILGPGRGLENLLEAFSKLVGEAHLVCVGWGEYEQKIKDYSTRFPNIHLHEPVPHAEVVPLVKGADFGMCMIEPISLSDYYCLPNKLFEYAFAGLPVLASKFPELERVVRDHKLGTTCDNDVSSIVNAVQDIIGRKHEFSFENLEELSWQRQAELLVAGYRTLVA